MRLLSSFDPHPVMGLLPSTCVLETNSMPGQLDKDSADASSTRSSSQIAIEDPLSQLLSGKLSEHVVTHPGQSQYNQAGGGASACGLAALNCARLVLGLHAAGLGGKEVARELTERRFLEDILKPCLSWESPSHLAVDEIHAVPLFKKSLTLLNSNFGQASYAFFTRLISNLASVTKERGASACMIITRPPEIIACFSIADVGSPLFVIFDSHPRPDKHPDGAAFILYNSMRSTARYLADLLQYDERLLRDSEVQWQTQLLAHCSGDVFVASDAPVNGAEWAETALEASLHALKLQAQVRSLELKAEGLEDEKKRLKEEVIGLEHDLLKMDDLFRRERAKADERRRRAQQVSGASHRPPPNSWVHSPWTQQAGVGQSTSSGRQAWSTIPSRFTGWFAGSSSAGGEEGASRGGRSDAPDPTESDRQIALEMQQAFDKENKELTEQLDDLRAVQPKFFECGICFEQYQEDHLALVQPCKHVYCRTCLGSFAVSKIEEHRYPILCPQCTADKTCQVPGEVDDEQVQQLGLEEEQYEIYVEMQMSKYSTMIHCRKCNNTMFVDKVEYDEAEVVHCPAVGCGHAWCKLCFQAVDPAGPQHTCDGSNELDHLMKQQGWKHCPGCQTPAEKISGCNHMTCMTPGCNMHFCYHCGAQIVRSALPREIAEAKARHFQRCTI
ncbi:hypothetical protein OH77DRAFT_1427184 [Trametes cingulata]|nr:hypothetical protein OH77DRAFT_1427184 [Trametes cingulata]